MVGFVFSANVEQKFGPEFVCKFKNNAKEYLANSPAKKDRGIKPLYESKVKVAESYYELKNLSNWVNLVMGSGLSDDEISVALFFHLDISLDENGKLVDRLDSYKQWIEDVQCFENCNVMLSEKLLDRVHKEKLDRGNITYLSSSNAPQEEINSFLIKHAQKSQ